MSKITSSSKMSNGLHKKISLKILIEIYDVCHKKDRTNERENIFSYMNYSSTKQTIDCLFYNLYLDHNNWALDRNLRNIHCGQMETSNRRTNY